MLPFKRILFPVDYSDPCLAIVPYVKETLRHFGATLSIVHAYGPEALAMSELPLGDPELPSEAKAMEEKRIVEFAAKHFPGTHVDTFVEIGEAAAAIHHLVQHQGADLVMLPTHGRGAVRRLLLGSVTAKVLHDVSAAVWTSTAAAVTSHISHPAYQKVLCAVDIAGEAAEILVAAAAIASSYRAELHIVHAVEMPVVSMEAGFVPYEQEIMQAAEDSMRNLKGKLNIDAPHAVIRGYIPEAVCEEAVRINADLIVVGRGHVQGAVSRAWSQLYAIVRQAPCPVLSI